MALVITVTDVFELQDGSLHFAPGVPFAVAGKLRLKAGDQLELRRHDGTTLRSSVLGLDFFLPSNGIVGFSLGKTLSKGDIPVGTEIWRVD